MMIEAFFYIFFVYIDQPSKAQVEQSAVVSLIFGSISIRPSHPVKAKPSEIEAIEPK